MRRFAAGPLLLVALSLQCATAHAASVQVDKSSVVCQPPKYGGCAKPIVRYRAGPGEANSLTLVGGVEAVSFRDAGASVTPGPGCTAVSANEATCTGFGAV